MGKGGEEIRISQSEKGKQPLRIGGKREDRLLRRGLVDYLKGINGVFVGKKHYG